MSRLLLRVAVVFTTAAAMPALFPPARLAQPGAAITSRRADAVLTTLVTPNGELRLRLTSRALFVGFTTLGTRRIRRAADSAFTATYGSPWTKVALGDDEAGSDKPDKPIPLRDLDSVRSSGDSLLLCFASKPGPAPTAPSCSAWRRFLITGLPPADAQRFAAAVRRARARSLDAPS